MSKMNLESPFEFGERVIIDGDPSLVARVVQMAFRSEIAECEISYVHSGEIKKAWVENWRLSPAAQK